MIATLVFEHEKLTLVLIGFGPRDSQLDDFHDSGGALFILQEIGVMENPGFAAMKGCNYSAMKVFGVGRRWTGTLSDDKVANPFQ